MPESYQNLDFNITWKQFIKCYEAGDFPIAYDNILIANILGMQKRGAPTPNAGVLLPSELSL